MGVVWLGRQGGYFGCLVGYAMRGRHGCQLAHLPRLLAQPDNSSKNNQQVTFIPSAAEDRPEEDKGTSKGVVLSRFS